MTLDPLSMWIGALIWAGCYIVGHLLCRAWRRWRARRREYTFRTGDPGTCMVGMEPWRPIVAPDAGQQPTDEIAAHCGTNGLKWAEAFAAANGGDRSLLTGWFALAIQQTLDLAFPVGPDGKAQVPTSRCIDCGATLRGLAAVASGLGCADHRRMV